jgi:hypothetical protein
LADELLKTDAGGAVIATLFNKVRVWFGNENVPDKCLQCGMPPGRQFMVATDEPIMHPHQCSWCKSILYVPGPMFQCDTCSETEVNKSAA